MADKRTLKKQIRFVCGDLAAECSMARHIIPGIDREKMADVIRKIAELQTTSLARATFAFDKTPADFASLREFKAARHAYYKAAYDQLKEQFNNEVEKIVHMMNAALPGREAAKAE
ncbi:MAG: hypothetical protein LIO90_09725 [Bacteroidales bacterium]|nr:hypothetical protein [Bacteroidales bacterium]